MPPRKPKAKKATKASSTPRAASRPAAKVLPGATKPSAPPTVASTPAVAKPKPKPAAAAVSRAPPPPPPPSAAAGSGKEMYKALYNFQGQDGELSLVKGEEVELKEKDDNGAWRCMIRLTCRVVESRQERSRRMGSVQLVSCVVLIQADASLKLVESAPPPPPPVTRRPPAPPISNGAANGSPASSRPTSVLGHKGPAPAPKPKPAVGAKPAIPSAASKPAVGGRPPVPSAPKVQAASVGKVGKVAQPSGMGGQLDLAAA